MAVTKRRDDLGDRGHELESVARSPPGVSRGPASPDVLGPTYGISGRVDRTFPRDCALETAIDSTRQRHIQFVPSRM